MHQKPKNDTEFREQLSQKFIEVLEKKTFLKKPGSAPEIRSTEEAKGLTKASMPFSCQ